MMILNPEFGSLYSTTDKNFAIAESFKPDSKVMFIDDIEKEFYTNYNNPNMINAALFLPPYSAMCAYQEGDDNKFKAIYEQHIMTNCITAISAILRSLCNGSHIMLYIPDHILSQASFFLWYLDNYYGLSCGNDRAMYMYNKLMQDNNIRFMFFMNHITVEELVCNIDLQCLKVDLELYDRLYNILNPITHTLDGFIEYLKQYKDSMLKIDKPLRPMVKSYIRKPEEDDMEVIL